MTDGINKVTDKVVVSLEYVLRLEDEREIDRSEEGMPLEYLHGYKNIIPGLEKELNGMKIGEKKNVIVQPEMGYGERNPESVVEYPRDSFPSSLNMEIGESILMRDNQTGDSHRAFIADLRPDTVLLDFNHPLAGETLHFSVKVAGLREPTGEELTHGHVHDGSHGH